MFGTTSKHPRGLGWCFARLLNAIKIAPNHKHPKKMPGSKNYIKLSMGDSEMMRNGNLQK